MNRPLPVVDYARHPAYGLMFEPDPALGARAERVLQPLIDASAKVQALRTARLKGADPGRDDLAAEVASGSYARLQMQGPSFERAAETAAPMTAAIRERLKAARAAGEPITFKLGQELVSETEHAPLHKAMTRLLQEAAVFDAVQAYFGAPAAKLKAAAVMVNQPDQRWTTNIFQDPAIETPPATGFHIDSDGACVLKTVLYLDDVEAGQGPFCVVPGSHAWEQGGQGRIHRRAFDKSEFVSRGEAKRRAFVSLPAHLQVKAEFGGDLVAGSPESDELLAKALTATGPRGQLNLFDPEAIHRGGQVSSGERVVVLASVAAAY